MNSKKKIKIYVAGPYTPIDSNLHDAPRIASKNVNNAIKAGIEIIKKGHIPFIPHLTHYIHLESDDPFSKEIYYEYDMTWLKLCDALLYLGSSPGADNELEIAKKLNFKIYYKIEDIPSVK